MLQRKNGPTLAEIMEKTSWQRHTVRPPGAYPGRLYCLNLHDRVQELPRKKSEASQAQTRGDSGRYRLHAADFPSQLHGPEALRAKEERTNQEYVVAWVPGLWGFIHAHENDPDPSAKLAQDFDERSIREMSVAALPIAAPRD
jgi:hypothetical protein